MHRSRRTLVTAMIAFAVLAGVVGCVPAPPERAAPQENVQERPAEESAPSLVADGTAEENLPYFTEVLHQFSTGSEPVRGAPVVSALLAAGFDRETMQVSFDESKTHLVADHIYVSSRFGSECLIGQIIESDRSTVTSVQPAVGPDQTLCLIGETRVIDW